LSNAITTDFYEKVRGWRAPVIAITANVLSENEREGARAGMKDFARRLLPLSVWKILAGNGCDLSAKTTNR